MSGELDNIYGGNSQWLKAADLQGQKPIVTIESAIVKENNYNGEKKSQIVLSFAGKEKKLGLNFTNAQRIADLIGTTHFETWVGWSIKLYIDKTTMHNGNIVDCIRIFPELPIQPGQTGAQAQIAQNQTPPQYQQRAELSPSQDNDDDIPF